MFKPFKAPSNNHQSFGQGDGAEHVTVKEFIDGVNEYFATLFGHPTVPVEDASIVLAEGLDEAHEKIEALEHDLANLKMKIEALVKPAPAPVPPTDETKPADPDPTKTQASEPDDKPAHGLAPEPATHTEPLVPDAAGTSAAV